MTRTARTLAAAALAAIAILALTAPGASAQHGVEVKKEPGGQHCNPCHIHVVGTATILSIEGIGPISACNDEFEGEIYESGEGHLVQKTLTGDLCNVEPCTSTSEREWPFELSEEGGELHLRLTFCVGPRNNHAGNESHCTLTLLVTDGGTHEYLATTTPSGRECQQSPPHHIVQGSWVIDPNPGGAHTNIEIEHN